MVVMNYTLQFLDPRTPGRADRGAFAQGCVPADCWCCRRRSWTRTRTWRRCWSTCITSTSAATITASWRSARKRAALENVLIPETVLRIASAWLHAGFVHSAVWLRYFNFVSIMAIKPVMIADDALCELASMTGTSARGMATRRRASSGERLAGRGARRLCAWRRSPAAPCVRHHDADAAGPNRRPPAGVLTVAQGPVSSSAASDRHRVAQRPQVGSS